MHVVEATDNLQEGWDAFVAGSPLGSFLQSWAWGDFQRAAGLKITRLLVRAGFADRDLWAACLLVHRPLPLRQRYLSAPWGPVLRVPDVALPGADDDTARVFAAFTAGLSERLIGGTVFARIEPRLPLTPAHTKSLSAHGYVVSGRSIQPRDTRILDLTQTEDELLRAMHPKTRYNIRLARRYGVTVTEQTTSEGIDVFLRLAREVERTGHFHYHPDAYYRAMLNILAPRGMLQVFVARQQGVPLAANMLFRFGTTVTFGHGANHSRRRHVMAPALLQWECVLQAKATGATRYDFFGIAPQSPAAGSQSPVGGIWKLVAGGRQPNLHPWTGITRFKSGFGGTEEHYVGGADLVGDPVAYRLYEVGRSLKTLLR